MQWIEKAKKVLYVAHLRFHFCCTVLTLLRSHDQVSLDSGAVGLDKVFELILEGKNLVIDVEKELEVMS